MKTEAPMRSKYCLRRDGLCHKNYQLIVNAEGVGGISEPHL